MQLPSSDRQLGIHNGDKEILKLYWTFMPLTFHEISCSFSMFHRMKNSKEFREIGKVYWTDQKLISYAKNIDIMYYFIIFVDC